MSKGDVTLLTGKYDIGSRTYVVASGAAASINAGEFVLKALGTGTAVSKVTDQTPSVGTTYLAGLALSTSTDTASANGTVEVFPVDTKMVFLCAPQTATSWDTQAEYDALVGKRVRFSVSAGVHTITATDGVAGGLVVEPLNIATFPNKVAFSVRAGALYNS